MGVIIRLAASPIGRRLARKDKPAAEQREVGDDDDPPEPAWCADCDREVLLEQPRCDRCGGEAISAREQAWRRGDLQVAGSATDLVLRADVRTVVLPPPPLPTPPAEEPSGHAS